MRKEVMIALRGEHATSFDEHAEMEDLRWSEAHGNPVDWELVKEVQNVLLLRKKELADAEWHQMRRRQWAAHKLCGLTYVKSFEAALRAAMRLFGAYDHDCAGAEDAPTLAVREYVAGSEPSNEVLAELARVADYHGHIRLARILRAGVYSEAEYRADKIQYALRRTARQRRHY